MGRVTLLQAWRNQRVVVQALPGQVEGRVSLVGHEPESEKAHLDTLLTKMYNI